MFKLHKINLRNTPFRPKTNGEQPAVASTRPPLPFTDAAIANNCTVDDWTGVGCVSWDCGVLQNDVTDQQKCVKKPTYARANAHADLQR